MQLPDKFKDWRGHCKFEDEALASILCRTRLGRGCGPVVRQTKE
jgi:hypothetical protein